METNSERTISNILNSDYKLGIIRYAENYDKYFKAMLEEKGLTYEMIAEFTYKLIMSAEHPLAQKENITFDDLANYIRIAHADPYVSPLSMAKVVREELPDNAKSCIYIFERASQFDLLSKNHQTFMWVSPAPDDVLQKYNLVQRNCESNQRIYKDILIYRNLSGKSRILYVPAVSVQNGHAASIDNEKCTSCGACVYQCPFGAISDKSFILNVIDLIKKSEQGKSYKLYAIVAPSISSQFTYAKLGQVVSGLKRLGFHAVVEAALGADMVAHQESDAKTIFIGPCTAKKQKRSLKLLNHM